VSSDGRTWTLRASKAVAGTPSIMTPLLDGTLLLESKLDGAQALWRSTDHGVTWQKVLATGSFRMLQTHSIRELDGAVVYGVYQSFSLRSAVRVNLWTSTDSGATWSVPYVFTGRRHVHSWPPIRRHELWALLGTPRRRGCCAQPRQGRTFEVVVAGYDGVAVDAGPSRRTACCSAPIPSASAIHPASRWLRRRSQTFLAPLALSKLLESIGARGGGNLLGTTRESSSEYAGIDSAYLYASSDGFTWQEAARYHDRRSDPVRRADVHWQLPGGEVVIELANVDGNAPARRLPPRRRGRCPAPAPATACARRRATTPPPHRHRHPTTTAPARDLVPASPPADHELYRRAGRLDPGEHPDHALRQRRTKARFDGDEPERAAVGDALHPASLGRDGDPGHERRHGRVGHGPGDRRRPASVRALRLAPAPGQRREVTWNQATSGSAWQLAAARGASDRSSTVLSAPANPLVTRQLHVPPQRRRRRRMCSSWVAKSDGESRPSSYADPANANGVNVTTRESTTASYRPKLTVTYQTAVASAAVTRFRVTTMDVRRPGQLRGHRSGDVEAAHRDESPPPAP
jgi:hypothetical protein